MSSRGRQTTLADVGEIALIDRIVDASASGPGVELGPGDDCAILRLGGRSWLWTTDSQIEGTHFERAWLTARRLGQKSYRVNASDIAAMGGQPRFVLVGLSAPASFPARDLAAIQRGIAESAKRDGALVVGGNLSRGPVLEVTISLLGEAPRDPVRRSGARPGDALYVTGCLGDAVLGLRRLRANPNATGAAVERFRRPPNRLRAGTVLATRRIASAMMDLSDGLGQDLGRLCRASGVGARVDFQSLPRSRSVRRAGDTLALHGGEDYELLCAVPVRKEKLLADLAPQLGCVVTRIGECRPAAEGFCLDNAPPDAESGFAHFAVPGRGTKR